MTDPQTDLADEWLDAELALGSIDPDFLGAHLSQATSLEQAAFAKKVQMINSLPTLLFLHGKESGPHGKKYQALAEAFLTVEAPDFRDMELAARLEKAEALTRDRSNVLLIGSSMGGLLAALLYSRHPERFRGYVLLAPALHWPEAQAIKRVPAQARVIHGQQDEIVPIADVEAFCSRFGLPLTRVEDNHALHQSQDLMLRAVRELRVPSSPETSDT